MNFILRLLVSALVVFFCSIVFPGIEVDGYGSAVLVALVVGFLNAVLKPILIFLTLPATLVTFGAFLLVINAFILQVADWLMDSFDLANFWWAILLGIILSIFNALIGRDDGGRRKRVKRTSSGHEIEGKTIYVDATD